MVLMIKKEKEQLFAGIRAIVKKELKEIKQALKEIRRIVDIHTETIAEIMVKVTIIEEDVSFIKITLEEKASKKELAALDHRVSRLER